MYENTYIKPKMEIRDSNKPSSNRYTSYADRYKAQNSKYTINTTSVRTSSNNNSSNNHSQNINRE